MRRQVVAAATSILLGFGCTDRSRVSDGANSSGVGRVDAAAAMLDATVAPSFVPATCAPQANCENGFCLIPAGTFTMGSPLTEAYRGRNNEDQVQVTFTHSFLLQQTEVTQGQWKSMGFP